MKPSHLFTGLLALTTLVVTSCSTPKMAQQGSIQDDVYNSTASAVAYERNAPSDAARYQDSISSNNYGSSNPNYDMDYRSRINNFYYGGPMGAYYDPYFDGFYGGGFSPFYSGLGWGMGYGMGWGMGFGMGYGWGNNFWGPYSFGRFSPFWGYMNWPYGGFMGGGFYGGGFFNGGFGGGYLVGNGNVTTGGRPGRGRENGIGYTNGGATRISNGSAIRNTDRGGVVLGGGRGSGSYNPNRGAVLNTRPSSNGTQTQSGRPTRTSDRNTQRPTRTESYTPTRSERPSYTPAPSSGGGRSSGGGGGGGASRPTRGGGGRG